MRSIHGILTSLLQLTMFWIGSQFPEEIFLKSVLRPIKKTLQIIMPKTATITR